MNTPTPPGAIVMNMFATGLGIARSLGERGISVTGLSARRGVYGNYTRFAKVLLSPDSRTEPELLLQFLIDLGKRTAGKSVIYPTRDDDVLFLDRFRKELTPYFIPAIPSSPVIDVALDKWKTYLAAIDARVSTPKSWMVETSQDLEKAAWEVSYPCVMKPVSAHHWRRSGNWEVVGGRKAIGVGTKAELLAEYASLAKAEPLVLIQELIPGADKSIVSIGCYMNQRGEWVAGYAAQKTLQLPVGFGTGCIVESIECPELLETSQKLLENLGYTGIAEVEFKWHADKKEYQLIEVNPRPWDQHRLGNACGVDVVYLSFCEYAGLPIPEARFRKETPKKWVAEEMLFMEILRSAWRRDGRIFWLLRSASGSRVYSIWTWRDPLPLIAYSTRVLLPGLIAAGVRFLWMGLKRRMSREGRTERPAYDTN